MIKILISLLINSINHEHPSEGVKSFALAGLVAVQAGLSWLLERVNKMVGSLMPVTIKST